MNIEIANRLVELRKKNGYSQEELANKLGLSRQAVSKWERAESSPDTDNLICLAKLYNVSLDDILNTDDSIDEIANSVKESNKEKEKEVNIEFKRNDNPPLWENIISASIALVCTIFYLTIGFLTEWGWRTCWTVFLLIPVIPSIFSAFRKKRFCDFLYPVFVTFAFLTIGMVFDLWHPTWILFITIPVYYTIFGTIDRSLHKDEKEDSDDDDEDNE